MPTDDFILDDDTDVKPDDSSNPKTPAKPGENAKPESGTEGNPPADDSKNPKTETNTSVEEIELEGKVYKVNAEGNAVDEAGNVILTKDDIAKYSTSTEEEGIDLDDIIKTTNIVITDSNGKPITYEASQKGITSYVADVYSKGREEGGIELYTSLIESYPILQDVLAHLELNKGSLDGFDKRVSWDKFTLDESNDEALIDVVIKGRMQKGDSYEEAKRFATYSKNDNKLVTDAKDNFEYLKRVEKAERDSKQKAIDDAKKADLDNQTKYWESVSNIITKDKVIKLGNSEVPIPEVFKIKGTDGKIVTKTRTDFYNYLYQPKQFTINNQTVNITEHQYDLYNENIKRNEHNDIYDAMRRFLKYDDEQLIQQKVEDTNAKKIKRLVIDRTKLTGNPVINGSEEIIL